MNIKKLLLTKKFIINKNNRKHYFHKTNPFHILLKIILI